MAIGNDHKISGTIKRLVDREEASGRTGGFGWIRAQDGQDYFFHKTELLNCAFQELAEGDAMRFVPVSSEKGPRANEVERSKG